MLKLVQKYGRRGEDEWGPLFHRILQNQIRDWFRRHRVRNHWLAWVRMADGEQGEDPIMTAPDLYTPGPESALGHRQSLSELFAALQDLPLRQQQVFMLRVWEGLDVSQTAKAMACSAGSVKTHLSRALQKLRERIGEYYLDDG